MIAINLNKLLRERNMNIPDLARHTGLSERNLKILASGNVQAIRISTLNILCETLDCKPGDLFDFVGWE